MRLVKDKALVIVGPQGSGKTQIARELAASAGTYAEVDGFALRDRGDWLDLLDKGYAAVVIDGAPSDSQMDTLKQILSTKGTVALRIRGVLRKVQMPHLIFTIDDANRVANGKRYLSLCMGRRFEFMHIHQPGHA